MLLTMTNINKFLKDVSPITKINKNYPPLVSAVSQKHLGLLLISEVSFKEHVYNKIIKCSKIIGLMKKVLNSV